MKRSRITRSETKNSLKMKRTSPLITSEEIVKGNSSDGGKKCTQHLPTEQSPLLKETSKNSKFTQTLRNFFATTAFTIQTFIVLFSASIINVSSTTLILDKVCLVHLKYPSDVCANLDNYTNYKASAEKMAANYSVVHKLLKNVPSILISFAAGQWSDKYGRKFFLAIALFGYAAESIAGCLCSYFEYSRIEYYFIGSVIFGVSGGHISTMIFIYSYISDTTTVKKRTLHFGFFEIISGLSTPLAIATGGWIYNLYGYMTVFLVSACGFVFAMVWGMLFLQETRGLDNTDSWKVKIKAMFSCTILIDSFAAAIKKRKQNGRQLIWLLTVGSSIVHSILYSAHDINFLYVHHQFNWGNTEYSTIASLYLLCGIVTLIFFLPILNRCRVSDPVIGIIGSISMVAKSLLIGLATETSVFHAANALGLFSGLTAMAFRSNLSKVIPSDEMGKLFAFVVTSDSIFPILLTAVVTQLFNIFLEIYPGMPYIFMAFLLLQPLVTFIWILRRKVPDLEIGNSEISKDATNKNITV